MNITKTVVAVLACSLLLCACDYIVLPEELSTQPGASRGWTAIVANVGKSDTGDLHIDITLRNDTGDWSAMQAATDRPTVLTSGGKSTTCDSVFVTTGGNRIPPGFQMRGYTVGTKAESKIQLLYVECKGASAAPGSRLSLDYSYYNGELNFYDQEANRANGKLDLSLDQVVKDLKYPIAVPVDGLVQKPGAKITAINDCILTLTQVTRRDNGFEFKWQTSNPGEYPTYVRIGNPPVIGAEGIIYGYYESPHLASAPMTGAGKTAEWTTYVIVPKDAKGLYVIPSVESKQQRHFLWYAIDITDK